MSQNHIAIAYWSCIITIIELRKENDLVDSTLAMLRVLFHLGIISAWEEFPIWRRIAFTGRVRGRDEV